MVVIRNLSSHFCLRSMILLNRFILTSSIPCSGMSFIFGIVIDLLIPNRLIALSLELDEDYFIQAHDNSANAETFCKSTPQQQPLTFN